MVRRSAPLLLVVTAALVAACGAAAVAPSTPSPVAAPASHVPASPAPTPVVVPASPVVVPASPSSSEAPAATPGAIGEVDGNLPGPKLSIVPLEPDTIAARLEDPEAKAWRIIVAGTGDHAADRWEITVETGDVAPVISAVEIVDDEVVDTMDLSGIWDETAVAGGCHSTLGVCLDSSGFRLPEDGDGIFKLRLSRVDAPGALTVRGGTAAWDGEPFILGPWTDTEAFPWE